MTHSGKSTRQFLQDGARQAALLLRALSNERRLLVLCLLLEHGEMSVGALMEHVELSQSAMSQPQSLHYSIVDPNVKRLIDALKKIYCP